VASFVGGREVEKEKERVTFREDLRCTAVAMERMFGANQRRKERGGEETEKARGEQCAGAVAVGGNGKREVRNSTVRKGGKERSLAHQK